MNYTHKYLKLNNKIYSTIRKNKKPTKRVNAIERETIKGKFVHYARIISIEKVKLSDLPLGLLLMDCLYNDSDLPTRKECYKLFQSFYKKVIDFENQEWYLFILEKLPAKKESQIINKIVQSVVV